MLESLTTRTTVAALSFVLGSLSLGWLDDSQDPQPTRPSDPQHVGFPETAIEYVKMFEPELGVPPRVDLDECVEIPLYVEGKRAYGNLGRKLDNQSFLGKDTVSGSTLQRYQGRTRAGKPLPDVIWIAFGRNSSSATKRFVGSVQMIGYHQKTGATAFLESSDRLAPWVTMDETTWRMRGVLPWIDDPEQFNRAFVPPGRIQCVQCHQSDPFITNPFINAAKIPGTDKTVIPKLDEESPYYVIGGENWDMRTIHIEGNQCFDCHRVGMSTVDMFRQNGWHADRYMPPRDPGSLDEDWRQLLAAWQKGPENVDGAEWVVPPARGEPGKVVGDDYPFQAWFNKPGANTYGVVQGKDGSKRKGTATANDKARIAEANELLEKVTDPFVRRAYEDWFEKNGVSEEVLAKLRASVGGKGKGKGKR